MVNVEDRTDDSNVDPAIGGYPFLARVTDACPDCRRHLARGSRRQRFDAGQPVVPQGAVGAGLAILTKGSAKEVVQGQTPGMEAVIRLFTEGQLYGLAAAVAAAETTSALMTLAPSEFLFIDQDPIEELLRHHPAMYPEVVRQLAYETRESHRWLASIL